MGFTDNDCGKKLKVTTWTVYVHWTHHLAIFIICDLRYSVIVIKFEKWKSHMKYCVRMISAMRNRNRSSSALKCLLLSYVIFRWHFEKKHELRQMVNKKVLHLTRSMSLSAVNKTIKRYSQCRCCDPITVFSCYAFHTLDFIIADR